MIERNSILKNAENFSEHNAKISTENFLRYREILNKKEFTQLLYEYVSDQCISI